MFSGIIGCMGTRVLQDEPHRRIERVGDTVRRPLLPWSPAVHDLLRHLESVDFPWSPRFLGIDEQGREILTYLDGDSGGQAWARVAEEQGLLAMARLLREFHDAVAGFRPPGLSPTEIVCHGDFGPWNLVWQGLRPVGILDWDYAWAARPVHDVAYALEYVTPFRDDAESTGPLSHPRPPDRRRRLELFAGAYGLTSTDGLVDEVIRQQEEVLERARQLAADGREPQLTWQRTGALDAVTDRIAWSRANTHLIERAP